jgi:hypothetical protein
MKTMPGFALAVVLVAMACADTPRSSIASFEVPEWSGNWYKGNTHAHTTESDGDSPPEYVARWYKDQRRSGPRERAEHPARDRSADR